MTMLTCDRCQVTAAAQGDHGYQSITLSLEIVKQLRKGDRQSRYHSRLDAHCCDLCPECSAALVLFIRKPTKGNAPQ
jgi:hypothetical protein